MSRAADPGVLAPRPARTGADRAMCRVLCIPDERPRGADVYSIFSASMLLSALRCLLTYVILPVVTPFLGLAPGIGPAIGIPAAIVALVFDVRGIRRFWLVNHPRRWEISAVYLIVMAMVTSLLVTDIVHLAA